MCVCVRVRVCVRARVCCSPPEANGAGAAIGGERALGGGGARRGLDVEVDVILRAGGRLAPERFGAKRFARPCCCGGGRVNN